MRTIYTFQASSTCLACTFRRLADDLSAYDTEKYRVTVVPSSTTGNASFHLGEPIKIQWQAPFKHSRKDWIGLYRVSFYPGAP